MSQLEKLDIEKSSHQIYRLFAMRDGWVETKLGLVSEFIMGQAPLGERCNKDGIGTPFVKAGEFEENRPKIVEWTTDPLKIAKSSDVLVCVVGATAGKINLGADCAIGRSVAAVRPGEKLHQLYLYYLLSLELSNLRSGSRGSAQGVITKDDLHRIVVALPPILEQKRIVDLISSVDSYIEALQQQLESAKRSRNAMLHELLTAGGDDWNETTLGEITDLVRGPFGGSLKKEIFVQEGFAVYEQQHAIYGDFSNIRYRISSEKFDEMKRFSLVPGDLIMSCSGTMGKVRIVPKEADPGIINQALLKIKPKSNLSSDFLYLWMQSDDFIRQIEMNSGGGALQNVSSVKMLKGIKLRVPGLLEQERIIGIISTIDEVKIKTELAIDEIMNLRSGLLSDLLSGEHEIPASYDKVMGAA